MGRLQGGAGGGQPRVEAPALALEAPLPLPQDPPADALPDAGALGVPTWAEPNATELFLGAMDARAKREAADWSVHERLSARSGALHMSQAGRRLHKSHTGPTALAVPESDDDHVLPRDKKREKRKRRNRREKRSRRDRSRSNSSGSALAPPHPPRAAEEFFAEP